MRKLSYTDAPAKYRSEEDYFSQTPILGCNVDTGIIKLIPNGMLMVRSPYPWDGASGPTIDSDYTMLPAFEHDALYELLSLGELPMSLRRTIDKFLRDRLIECGCYEVDRDTRGWRKAFKPAKKAAVRARAWAWFWGVRTPIAEKAARHAPKVKTLEYP